MERIENYIYSKYVEISSFEDIEYISLYEDIPHETLKNIFKFARSIYLLI